MKSQAHSNEVMLLGYYGSDQTHCLSAWQSTNLDLGIELPDKVQERIEVLFAETVKNKRKSSAELLKFLAQHEHHTPFEKSCLHFQVRADIASHIHLIKHRIAVSINSESARYKELEDKWYLPSDWQDICVDNDDLPEAIKELFKQSQTWQDVLNTYTELGHELYHLACQQLGSKLGRKRSKETARYFLPYNKQLDFDVMFNFRSFMHFQKLRNSQQAQTEIQAIAQQMLELIQQLEGNPFKESLQAFGY
ncbi:FAD-dependent thymidylate synthase [Gloeocapsa sp. PCC 73106]|uniref:FAD-dependent thymidylate synthase n=1 Tax=Gloeocapsa sp. PCC 73106 TaxID=102232 RepID=UPI0002ACB27D|nr:FAD-dependent thymidylate synthase [Gloeocapsa sp. PCC 73106]ELR98947.1 thymidylate synthase, flavin-dependent [Gloeocapsa sp. PCC 73106]